MICFLFGCLSKDKNIPKTETEINSHFILAVALRKLRNANPLIRLHSLEDMPDSDKEIFKQLCSLAFNMTVNNKEIVPELPMSLESPDCSCLRDLLTIGVTAQIARSGKFYSVSSSHTPRISCSLSLSKP